MRILLVLVFFFATFAMARAQNPVTKPSDTVKHRIDTIKPEGYINQGKIAGKKAFHRALLFPGLGQIYNYGLVVKDVQSGEVKGKRIAQKGYILLKLGGLYAGGALLVMSYADNRKEYKRFLTELQDRQEHKGAIDPNSPLARYTNTDALNVAKNIYKRNSQVVLISIVGLYGLSAVDAYVAARLKYFNIDKDLALKVSPSFINPTTAYGFNAVPSLKLTLKL